MWAASDVIGSVTATVDFTEEMLAIEQILFLDLGEKNPPVLQFKVVLEGLENDIFTHKNNTISLGSLGDAPGVCTDIQSNPTKTFRVAFILTSK